MVNKCCVPKCRTGLSSNINNEKVFRHRFPTDGNMMQQWIRNIPRKNWIPNKNSVVCSLHFLPTDFSTNRLDSNKSCCARRKEFAKKTFKTEAVPTVFSHLFHYFTIKKTAERTGKSTSAARLEFENFRLKMENEKF